MRAALRAVTSLIVFAIMLEFCARVDDRISYGAPLWSPYSVEGLYELDHVGKRGKPGARYKKWQLNSLGFRGPELRPGTVRIVCFGASETFGLYEDPDQEYPRQLERVLNARAGKDLFQVVNVAYAGETVATAALRVTEIVDAIHPRYAVIYPAPATYIWLPGVRRSPSGVPISAVPRFEPRIADRMQIVLKTVLPDAVQTQLRQWEIDREASGYTLMDSVPEENVRRFRSDLLALVNALREKGVEPVLVTHATAFGECPAVADRSLLVLWRKFYPMLKEEGFIEMEGRMNDAIRALTAEQHVTLVDATREMPPGRIYFADFAHFTTVGSELMASKLAAGMWATLMASQGTAEAVPSGLSGLASAMRMN